MKWYSFDYLERRLYSCSISSTETFNFHHKFYANFISLIPLKVINFLRCLPTGICTYQRVRVAYQRANCTYQRVQIAYQRANCTYQRVQSYHISPFISCSSLFIELIHFPWQSFDFFSLRPWGVLLVYSIVWRWGFMILVSYQGILVASQQFITSHFGSHCHSS